MYSPDFPKTHWIDTELYGLFGTPLRKSASPAMHNSNFASLGLNAVYFPFEIGENEIEKVLPALAHLRFKGGNVTMPLKRLVVPMLDSLEKIAELGGAVNTIRIKDGKISGTNTDGPGFVRALQEQCGYSVAGKSCALFGSGGAARGVAFALMLAGVTNFKLFDMPQSKDMMKSLESDINAYKNGACVSAFNDDDNAVGRALAETELVVNATSAGMYPDKIEDTPFNTKLLRPDNFVSDVVYIPRRTKLIIEAEAVGCKTMEGHWMTIWQGADAFEYWTGKKANISVMAETVLRVMDKEAK